MTKLIRYVLPTIVMLFLLFVGFDLAAQGPPGGGPGGQSGCIPTCIPIDGGISFLVAAGAALGGKKLFDQIKR